MPRRELYLWPFAKSLYHVWISMATSSNENSWKFSPPKMKSWLHSCTCILALVKFIHHPTSAITANKLTFPVLLYIATTCQFLFACYSAIPPSCVSLAFFPQFIHRVLQPPMPFFLNPNNPFAAPPTHQLSRTRPIAGLTTVANTTGPRFVVLNLVSTTCNIRI